MKIVYMVTNRCNANCPHCYNRKSKTTKKEKSLIECEQNIISLRAMGHEVIVAGSEVLCDPEKLFLYQSIGQKYLLSNGIIPAKTPSIFCRLGMAGISEVRLSWHYNFPELSGQFPEEITLQAIKNAKSNKFIVCLNCVVGSPNFALMEALCEKAFELGVKEVNFIKLLPMNAKVRRFRLTNNQTKKVIDAVSVLREKYSKETLCVRLHANFNSELTVKSREAKKSGSFCPAGKEFLVIATNGDIYPCPFLQEKRFRIGCLCGGFLRIEKNFDHDGRNCLASSIYK